MSNVLAFRYRLSILSPEEPHIFGGVSADGTKWYGEGFTASKGGTGTYTVIFDPADRFDGNPGLGCTVFGDSAVSVRVTAVSTSSFTCVTLSASGSPVDSAFTFIAFGDAD